jgi:hypothetical protein
LALEKHRRHDLVDLWCATPDAAFYAEGHTYMEGLVRLTTSWLRRRANRTREQEVALARAHRRKLQDVTRDLDKLLVERRRAGMIWREKKARQAEAGRQQATAQAYNGALAAVDDDDEDNE